MKTLEIEAKPLNKRTTTRRSAERVLQRCDLLATCSDSKTGLTRLFLSPAMKKAHERVATWMREAGMTPRVDEMGNLIGHFPAAENSRNAPTFLLGSHLDTVPDAGKYDGMLGVLLAIEVVSSLQNALPFALEVIGFSEEEGVRFRTPYLGSRARAGTFDSRWLELRDGDGISMKEALRGFALAPEAWQNAQGRDARILGYLEAHIEQGTQLESLGAPLGIVSAIVGQSRLKVRFRGQAGHAGTWPMGGRRDALTAAAEWILAVEKLGENTPGLVATVGALEVEPNTSNVVPGAVSCSLDVRHAVDERRETGVETLLQAAKEGAARRGIAFEVVSRSSQIAVPLDERLRGQLEIAGAAQGLDAPSIASGAGHDAAIMAELAPAAMLFLRSPGGASHCPQEAVEREDVALALEAMHQFLLQIAEIQGETVVI